MARGGFCVSYKQDHSLEKRKEESARMLGKYVDRIPRLELSVWGKRHRTAGNQMPSGGVCSVCTRRAMGTGGRQRDSNRGLPPPGSKSPPSPPAAGAKRQTKRSLSFDAVNLLICFFPFDNKHTILFIDFSKVIVEKAQRSDIQCIDKKKYLVPLALTVGQFASVIRKRINLTPEKAMFLFVDNILPSTGATISAVYNEKKDEDGFLYVIYSAENTFGGQ